MHPFIYVEAVYSEHDPLPRTMARCVDCGQVLDPGTGIILELGNPAKIEDPFAIPGGDP